MINFDSFDDQKPGTSGLRKKTSVFMKEHYVESFAQATLDVLTGGGTDLRQASIIIGGDGRYYNIEAINRIAAVLVANKVGKILIAQDGLMSTPAMSACIRERKATGGFILSASHNPGGPDEDFGIKFNIENGGPAPAQFTEEIYSNTKVLKTYPKAKLSPLDLSSPSCSSLEETLVEIISSTDDYIDLLKEVFDFEALSRFLKKEKSLLFDAMNAVTGPYAERIFVELLGASSDSVFRSTPLPDFGGCHPDPNLVHAADLVEKMNKASAPLLGAASDGDGDRNLILGQNVFVSPGDSLAVIAAHANECIPAFKTGISGVARSMPTSRAVDRVAKKLGIECFETPTGWKFFGNLLDAGRISVCGEESFGTSSEHVREKDGIWAVLAWLSILQKREKNVSQIMSEHWSRFGRNYFQRHDYEGLDSEKAKELMKFLEGNLEKLVGQELEIGRIEQAENFSYTDPIDGSIAEKQGIRIILEPEARLVVRLSGTGTSGATLRLYFETYSSEETELEPEVALRGLQSWANELLELKERFSRDAPCVVT